MELNAVVTLLLVHLAETTAERDQARMALQQEVGKLRERCAELEEQLAKRSRRRAAPTPSVGGSVDGA